MVQACAKWSWLLIKPIALDNVIIPKVVSTNLVELDRSKTAAFSGPIWGRAGQQIWCSAPDPWAAKLLLSRCSPYSTRRRCGPCCSYRENILDLCWELLYITATAYFVRKRPVLLNYLWPWLILCRSIASIYPVSYTHLTLPTNREV